MALKQPAKRPADTLNEDELVPESELLRRMDRSWLPTCFFLSGLIFIYFFVTSSLNEMLGVKDSLEAAALEPDKPAKPVDDQEARERDKSASAIAEETRKKAAKGGGDTGAAGSTGAAPQLTEAERQRIGADADMMKLQNAGGVDDMVKEPPKEIKGNSFDLDSKKDKLE